MRAARRRWYANNRDRALPETRDRTYAYRARNKETADRAKSKPCEDCGVQYPAHVMQFDHVDGTKVRAISQMVHRGFSLEKLRAEIEKCEVVCGNCHADRTWRRRQEARG